MSKIDEHGIIVDSKVILRRFPSIEHGPLDSAHAIVVHQTDSSTAQQTFNSYNSGGNGAHFLIDKDGQIYQTASINKRCYHVGRLIKSKCLSVGISSCKSADMAKAITMSWSKQIRAIDAIERGKSYPERYPVNGDSVGIELVGRHIDDDRYEVVRAMQNSSLKWLVGELFSHLSITDSDVYKHPEISYKHPGEASSAKWY